MLKAVIFDFDGVIVDSEPLHHRALAQVAYQLGVVLDYQTYVRNYIGYDDRDVFRLLLRESRRSTEPGSEAEVVRLCQEKAAAFVAVCANGVAMIPGALELIQSLSDQYPLAIASGATRQDIDLVLAGLDLADLFQVIVSADDVARSKPDPQTYSQAVRKLAKIHTERNLKADQCLAIEDTAVGLASARDAGLITLGLASTGPASDRGHADRVVETLVGLTVEQLRAWTD